MEHFKQGELTSGNLYGGYGETFKESARITYPFAEGDDYHTIGLYWSEYGYVFYVDGIEMARTNEPASKVEQFILISTEVQGYRNGKPKTEFTDEELNDKFIVDYVRVFDRIK